MKRKIEYSPNILLFEFITCFVENDLNLMKTARVLKKERSNLSRLFNNFCKQENMTFYTVHNGKKEITRQGAYIYYHAKVITTTYKQIRKCTSDWYK